MHETRSGEHAQLHLAAVEPAPEQGVGGRRGPGRRRRRGGGYLNECTPSEVWEAAKIRELEAMGLPAIWLEVATEIGFHRFIAMWRLVDRAAHLRSESESMILVQLRRFSSYERFQRNRFIETLVHAGFDDRAIRAQVREQLGENLSLSHISRLASRRKVRHE